jgi:Phage tail lysozyme
MADLIADFGLEDFQAAGILGNIGHECAGFRLMQEVKPRGGRGGFGWCQWTGSRRVAFENFCSENGLLPTRDLGNYRNLKRELLTREFSGALQAVRQARTIVEAVRAFEAKFEKAAADAKHFDRRDKWADIAIKNFKMQIPMQIPAAVARILDRDVISRIVATAKSGTATFWLIEQIGDDGGQVLVRQAQGQDPQILAQDSTIFPLKAGLVPPDVAVTLLKAFKPAVDPGPGPSPAGPAASDDERAKRVFARAKARSGNLITRNAEGTNGGRLACAFAVNTVVKEALGKPIGGGLSTTLMGQVLKEKHTQVPEKNLVPGCVVISPTEPGKVGHVGIVGAIAANPTQTPIYSNSSSKGVFLQNFTVARWKAFYGGKRLPVLFYALKG